MHKIDGIIPSYLAAIVYKMKSYRVLICGRIKVTACTITYDYTTIMYEGDMLHLYIMCYSGWGGGGGGGG